MNIKKNAKYLGLLVTFHVVLYLWLELTMTIDAYFDLGDFMSIAMYVFRYAVVLFIAYLMFTKWKNKCNTLILPLSFFLLAIVLYILMFLSFEFYPVIGIDIVGPEMFGFDALAFSCPLVVLTLIPSVVLEIKKLKAKQTEEDEVALLKNRKGLAAAIAIFTVTTIPFATSAFTTKLSNEQFARWEAETVYTEIISFKIDDNITEGQVMDFFWVDDRTFFLEYPQGRGITDAEGQKEFEDLFGKTLPKLDYENYYYSIDKGKMIDWSNEDAPTPEEKDPRRITVYKVNVVK